MLDIAIITQNNYTNAYQTQRLKEEFTKLKTKPTVIPAESIILKYEQNILTYYSKTPSIIEPFNYFDLYVFREIFSVMKDMITTIQILKNKNAKVFDNNLTKTFYLNDKLKEGEQLLANNINFPKTLHFMDKQNLLNNLDFLEQTLNAYPIIAKKRSSGKGLGIYKINSRKELIKFAEQLCNEHKYKENAIKLFIFQEFLNIEKEYRVFVVGQKIVGAMQRIPKQGDFRANFSLGGTVKPAQITKHMQEISLKAHKAVLTEISGVDYAITKDNNYYILEVNRTPGFKGLEQATGKNIAYEIAKYLLEKYKQ